MRTGLFIDGPHVYVAGKVLGIDIDYRKLKDWVTPNVGPLARAWYFTQWEKQEAGAEISIKPLIDFLDYNGYTVVTREVTGKGGRATDVALTCAALDMADTGRMDQALLVIEHREFLPLVESLKRRGIFVTVMSVLNIPNPLVSDTLRRAADRFIDMADPKVRNAIMRDQSERRPRMAG